MDAKDIRNLSEAYREVYASPEELDEASSRDEFTRAAIARNSGRKGGITFEPGPNWDPSANRGKGAHLSPKQKEKQRRKALRQENVDLYDIILSHLLDEGYAETVEAAEVIMVNMSEDWRESIMEADSLAAFQARREKRRAAMKKKTGYEGHDYSKPPAQAAAEREERMRKFINKD